MASLLDAFIKKPKVSNFDVSRTIYTTANQGTLIPSFIRYMVPGETLKLVPSMTVRTNPATAPMYGRWEIRVDTFFAPYRLYNPAYRLNDNDFDIYNTVHPVVRFSGAPTGDFTNAQARNVCVSPGSLWNHLGLPAWWINVGSNTRDFNAYSYLAYHDIYRNYYIDPQRTWAMKMRCFTSSSDADPKKANPFSFSVSALDSLIKSASQQEGYIYPAFQNLFLPQTELFFAPDAGLLLRTYKPDLFTANLDSAKLNDVYQTNAVQVQNGVFTWQQLRFSSKLTRLGEITRMVGGRYSDWLAGVFGQESKKNLDIPQYLGSSVMHFRFSETTVTASTEGAEAGEMVGKGSDYQGRFRPIRFTAKEYGVLMTLVSIVPIPAYGNGIDPFLMKLNATDDYNPVLDNIGFQDIPREWFDAVRGGSPFSNTLEYPVYGLSDSGNPRNQVLGSMPAWSEYCTNWDVVRGEFANPQGLPYWVLSRFFQSFSPASSESDLQFSLNDLPSNPGGVLGSYINPAFYQYPFSVQDANAQNFFLELGYDAKTTLPKSKNVMPTLA